MKIINDLKSMYAIYVDAMNDENFENRYKGKEHYYHAAASGSCARKLYYHAVVQADETNPMNDATKRKLRLGTIFHQDMENCADYIVNYKVTQELTSNYKATQELTSLKSLKDFKVNYKLTQEEEIIIPEFNVRGFFDLLVETKEGEIILIDYKTIGSWPWKLKFGKDKKPSTNLRYELQMGTYGYAIEKKYGRIDGLVLLYYNKDTSVIKHVSVPLKFVDLAYEYWSLIHHLHQSGLPAMEKGVSPVEDWECNYCQFHDLCKGIK